MVARGHTTVRSEALGLALVAALWVAPLAGQEDGSSYSDETARTLHTAAMEARERFDDSIVRYTAVVKQRVGASLRTPLKDRTLFRMESAHRLFWSRDGEDLVQVLALRRQTPLGIEELEEELVDDLNLFDERFDPVNDRLLFGFADDNDDYGEPGGDDFWFEHPLYPEWVSSYRFITGDTLRLSLPDGRTVLAIELQVIPRVADVHRMTGSLWIEPETGNLVRAVYRLSDTFDAFRDIPDLKEEEDDDLRFVPGLLKPWTADISMIAVDYSLWDFDVWLPRSMRMEGVVSAGILKAPGVFDLSYEIEAVTTERSLAEGTVDDGVPEVHFETRREAMAYLNELAFGADGPSAVDDGWTTRDGERTRFLYPADPSVLAESPELPPPVWEDAPGFASQSEISELFDGLAELPLAPVAQVPTTLRWGFQRPDLMRYNRVEALSVGMRGQLRPQSFLGPLSVSATGRLGFDLEPNVRVDVTRETLRRRVTLSAYNELAAVDEGARHLGIGNSVMAAFFGRDDGDYYYRSGGALEWTPPTADRQTFRVRGYGEYHRPATTESSFVLFRSWTGFAFRPDLPAAEGWEVGGVVALTPWWGTDPNLVQGGLDLTAQAAVGDFEYQRVSLVGRLAVPLPSRMRLGLEAGGGTAWGSPAPQRLWYVGGSRTLRGYDPLVRGGTSFVRGRAELARKYAFGAVALFSDVGWAGERGVTPFDSALYSAGLGLSLLDGLIRMDGAYGLRAPKGFRFDFYLDAIL